MIEENFDRRGEATRQALIEAGLELFGDYGFKATSTRMLAEHANANISAIPYYFRNKEGLYTAVIEYIAEQIQLKLGHSYTAVRAALEKPELNNDEAQTHLGTMMEALAHLFVESEDAKSWALIILKEQIKPTPAYDILYDNVIKHEHQALSILIARMIGCEPDHEIAIIKAHMLIGQVLIFLSARETLLRRLGVKKLTSQHISLINKLLCKQAIACIQVEEAT
jgi:AcrR family transcriptional regulator